jgi:FHA domain
MANSPYRAHPWAERMQDPGGYDAVGSDSTGVPQPVLAVRSPGELQGRTLRIRPGTQVIGRQPDCELCIDDGFVSRRHAVVVRDETRVTIQDTGSVNGTSVNGEQLLAGPRALRSGDAVRIGRIELVYLDGLETASRRLALLQPPEGAPPVEVLSAASEDTPALRPAAPAPGRQTADSLLPLAPTQLAVSAVAAAVTALLLSGLQVERLGQSWLGSIGAAALTSVVATLLQTRGRGHLWRLAGGAGLALALAVGGISLPELGLHRALTNRDRPATFVPPRLTPSATTEPPATTGPTTTTGPPVTTEPPAGPHISVDPTSVVCPAAAVGQAATCPVVTIRSIGSDPLLVRSFEIVGPAAGDFQVVADGNGTSPAAVSCLARPLAHDETCTVAVTFGPTQAGLRSGRLIVHQNLPRPDTGTPVDLTGQGVDGPTTTT